MNFSIPKKPGKRSGLCRKTVSWSKQDSSWGIATAENVGPSGGYRAEDLLLPSPAWATVAAGNITGSQTRSLNGDIADETFTGTQNVNSDCTGEVSVQVFENGVLVRTTTLHVDSTKMCGPHAEFSPRWYCPTVQCFPPSSPLRRRGYFPRISPGPHYSGGIFILRRSPAFAGGFFSLVPFLTSPSHLA